MEIRNVPPINTRLLETLKDIVFVVEVTEQQQGKQLLDLINTAREVIDEAEAKCNTPERQALQHYGKGMAKMLNKALTDDPPTWPATITTPRITPTSPPHTIPNPPRPRLKNCVFYNDCFELPRPLK